MDFLVALKDPRPLEQRAKNFQHRELGASVPVVWREKPPSEWKSFSLRKQSNSSSCGGQAAAKGIEVFRKEVISAHPIYRARANFPQQGMWLQDIGDILKKKGTTTEVLDPSQNLGEDEMNKDVTVPTPIKVEGYAFPDMDIDEIAEAVETHGHCLLLVHGNFAEWSSRPVFNEKQFNFGHFVTAVDYTLSNGEKCLVIEDSTAWESSINQTGQRLITEAYLGKRFDDAMYFIFDKTKPVSDKPKFKFTKVLKFGMMNDPEVKALQDILKYEKLFLQATPSTGNYLQMTAKAVLEWQKKHAVAPLGELTALAGKRCGEKTIAMLNSLYN